MWAAWAGLVLAWGAGLGCAGHGRGQSARALAPGEPPPGPAVGLGTRTDVAPGALAYAVAFADDRTLVTVELTDAFALVVRDLVADGAPGSGQRVRYRVRRRIPLGPADFDIDDLAVDAAGTQAWVASHDGTVRAYDLRPGASTGHAAVPQVTWHLGSSATAVAVSPDGRFVAVGTADGILCLRRRRDGALLQCVVAHGGRIAGLDFAPEGKPVSAQERRPRRPRRPGQSTGTLASGAWDGTVAVWRVPSLAVRARRAFAGSVNDVAFDPAGARLAIARSQMPPRRSPAVLAQERAGRRAPPSPANTVAIWPLDDNDTSATKVPDRALGTHGGPVTAVAWTPDGARLTSASWDRAVRLWDPATGVLVARHHDFAGLIRDLAVAPGGGRLAVAAWPDIDTLADPASAVIDLLFSSPVFSTAPPESAAISPAAAARRLTLPNTGPYYPGR